MKDRPEKGKRPGNDDNAGTKNWNESELEEHSQGELKETITDELMEDDPDEPQEFEIEDQDKQRMLKPTFLKNPSLRTLHRRS